MASTYSCHQCGGRFSVSASYAGKAVPCPRCEVILLPDIGAAHADQQRAYAQVSARGEAAAQGMRRAQAMEAANAAKRESVDAGIRQRWLEKCAEFVERDRDPVTGEHGEETQRRLKAYMDTVAGRGKR